MGEHTIGTITSGTYSYHLKTGIGQGYVRLDANVNPGDGVAVMVRDRSARARLAKLPLLPPKTKLSWTKVKGKVEL